MTKKDDILRLIEITGMISQTKQIMEMQLEAIKIEDREVYDIINENKIFDEFFENDLKNIVIEIYEKYFDEKQIKKLLEFYEDPSMQKLMEKGPKIYEEITEKIETIMEKRLDEIDFPDD